MQALCLITVKPGTVDRVVKVLKKKRKLKKEIMMYELTLNPRMK